jgi:malonyl-CoA O-methyltransferase
LLAELRSLGGQSGARAVCRAAHATAWRERLHAAMARRLASAADGGALTLSFEVIYGHAVKPPPRHTIAAQTTISLDDLKVSLRQRNRNLPSV